MLTIKWTQPSGAVSLHETKNVCTLIPKTEAWDEYIKANPDFLSDKVRAIVMHDSGTIIVFVCEAHLYIVNDNGKTIQTV